ncbi:MAG: diphthine--ammonia ligase [Promethearchaeota archaeon]
MRVFVSWSGGKDSCLALHRALSTDLKVEFLFSMLGEDGIRSRGHGLRKDIIEAQSKALGIPIVYGNASWEDYEAEFKRVMKQLREKGIEGGVFGDIDFQEHRDWVERVCDEVGLKAFEPLWNQKYETLLSEFIQSGFEAIVVSAKADLFTENWIGHLLNWKFIDYLKKQNIDLCGEDGEYHTLTINGPIFQRRIEILASKKVLKADRRFLEIENFNLVK